MPACCSSPSRSSPLRASAQDVTVFAAASLTTVLEQVGKLYREKRGAPVKFSFAASSTLAKQIESGAGADIFISADEQWMDYLAQRRLIEAATRVSAPRQRVGADHAARPEAERGHPPWLRPRRHDRRGRLATGDPAHVPVGRYAEEALTRLGVWQAVAPKLARTDNVRAALLLVERGEAPFGIVYATDAAASGKVNVAGVFPADTHAPVSYPAAILATRDRPEVRRFFDFMLGSDAQQIYRAAGFTIR